MVSIYHLSISGRVFYVGATVRPLRDRLRDHVYATAGIFELPQWLKDMIEITAIEECLPDKSRSREIYWIKQHIGNGITLLNKSNAGKALTRSEESKKYRAQGRTQWIQLTDIECQKIAANGLRNTAKRILISPRVLANAIKRKRIRNMYYKNIFVS